MNDENMHETFGHGAYIVLYQRNVSWEGYMGEPLRKVLHDIGKEVGVENPLTISYTQLAAHIQALPKQSFVGDRDEILDELNARLDGARPPF